MWVGLLLVGRLVCSWCLIGCRCGLVVGGVGWLVSIVERWCRLLLLGLL